jgi:Protein of unknown function (DUF3105)
MCGPGMRFSAERVRSLVLLVALAGGCGDNQAPTGGPLGPCDGLVTEVADEPGIHVPPGTTIAWSSNPPATGRHYPTWAGWGRTYASLPRGYWMHNAEHGGVVLLGNCPQGCADEIAGLLAVVRARPTDAKCAPPVRNRLLVVADPELPSGVKIAAVAWGAYYTASCLDAAALSRFIEDRYARAPEDLCADGLAMGGTIISAAP